MFESGNELERNLNQCPQCIEKTQDEMLRQMFGQSEPSLKKVKQSEQLPTLRDNAILAMRMKGKTLEEIGLSFNLTRERVRQIISKFGSDINFPKAAELRRNEREIEIRAIAVEISANWGLFRKYSFAKLAKEYNLTIQELKQIVTKVQHAYLSANEESHIEKQWTSEDCIEVLKEAATYAFPLTVLEYRRLIKSKTIIGPTFPIFCSRFGSWADACAAAGVETGIAQREYDSAWSDSDLIRIVRHFLWESTDTSWSIENYDKWRASHESQMPSIGLLRNRLGTWSEIRVLALEADLPEFDMFIFDTLEMKNA
jgi:Mor family transcriptional regulator